MNRVDIAPEDEIINIMKKRLDSAQRSIPSEEDIDLQALFDIFFETPGIKEVITRHINNRIASDNSIADLLILEFLKSNNLIYILTKYSTKHLLIISSTSNHAIYSLMMEYITNPEA